VPTVLGITLLVAILTLLATSSRTSPSASSIHVFELKGRKRDRSDRTRAGLPDRAAGSTNHVVHGRPDRSDVAPATTHLLPQQAGGRVGRLFVPHHRGVFPRPGPPPDKSDQSGGHFRPALERRTLVAPWLGTDSSGFDELAASSTAASIHSRSVSSPVFITIVVVRLTA